MCGHELEHIVSSLETDAQKLSEWFLDNSMKLNPDKCHLLIFGEKNTDVSVQIGATAITESVEEKPLLRQSVRAKVRNNVHIQSSLHKATSHKTTYTFSAFWFEIVKTSCCFELS